MTSTFLPEENFCALALLEGSSQAGAPVSMSAQLHRERRISGHWVGLRIRPLRRGHGAPHAWEGVLRGIAKGVPAGFWGACAAALLRARGRQAAGIHLLFAIYFLPACATSWLRGGHLAWRLLAALTFALRQRDIAFSPMHCGRERGMGGKRYSRAPGGPQACWLSLPIAARSRLWPGRAGVHAEIVCKKHSPGSW